MELSLETVEGNLPQSNFQGSQRTSSWYESRYEVSKRSDESKVKNPAQLSRVVSESIVKCRNWSRTKYQPNEKEKTKMKKSRIRGREKDDRLGSAGRVRRGFLPLLVSE